jgi:formylglycine-generating enzyme required for sulfatase activity
VEPAASHPVPASPVPAAEPREAEPPVAVASAQIPAAAPALPSPSLEAPVAAPAPTPAPVAAPVKPAGPPAPAAFVVAQDAHGFYGDLTVAGQALRFRHCAPGSFTMGSPAAEPGHGSDEAEHAVTLTRGFWIADSECTQRLWQLVLNEKPSSFEGETLPVNKISRDDAQRFCAKLNALVAGLGARLPWEAEWEFACRAGSADPYPGFWRLDDTKACYGTTKPRPVKSYPCNAWGLYDMVGNVREWCQDGFAKYPAQAVNDPHPTPGDSGVSRGGCWEDSAKNCRSASRHESWIAKSSVSNGLRVVVDEPPRP